MAAEMYLGGRPTYRLAVVRPGGEAPAITPTYADRPTKFFSSGLYFEKVVCIVAGDEYAPG